MDDLNYTNTLKISGSKEDLTKLQEEVIGESLFNLEKIKPTPSELASLPKEIDLPQLMYDISAFVTDKHTHDADEYVDEKIKGAIFPMDTETAIATFNLYDKYEHDEAAKEEAYQRGKIYLENIDKFGSPTQHEWRVKNWGCVYNTTKVKCTVDDNGTVYMFETPGMSPLLAISTLAEKYPELKFTLWSACNTVDGENWGIYSFKGKAIGHVDIKDFTKDHFAIALRVHSILKLGICVYRIEDIFPLDMTLNKVTLALSPEEMNSITDSIKDTDIMVGFDDDIQYCVVRNDSYRSDFLYPMDDSKKLIAGIRDSIKDLTDKEPIKLN